MKSRLLIFCIISLILFSCKSKTAKKDKPDNNTGKDTTQVKIEADSNVSKDPGMVAVLTRLTSDILTEIKKGNYPALANYIDPVTGLRFSPYGFVDTLHDVVLSKEDFLKKTAKPNDGKILWGEMDGSGEPIRMTINQYMKRFVYDVDFVKPEKFTINEFTGHSNSFNNLKAIYYDCDFTESHFSGLDKKYEGMDWRSLKLVYRLRYGQYYLAGIVHDEWTT